MTSDRVKPSDLGCRFCGIGAGRAHFEHDRVLMESDEYYAIASIGGFIEGWTLVCAKRHVLNLAADYRQRAFREFVGDVAEVVSSAYGPVAVFEHGVRRHGSLTGCGTDHAHLHLVPFRGSFSQCVLATGREEAWFRAGAQEAEQRTEANEYLLMADSVEALEAAAYVSIVDRPESQYFRKVLAAHTGIPAQFDYRAFPFVDTVARTARRVSEIVSERCPAVV
jgi:diadenosine tetraphosphate (Ap4A) HIT family hydrolase